MDVLARSAPSAYFLSLWLFLCFSKVLFCAFFCSQDLGIRGFLAKGLVLLHLSPSSGMVCSICRCRGAPCFLFVPADKVPEVFDVVLDEYCFRRMICCCWFGGSKEKVAASKNRLDKLFRNFRRQGEI
ncbi:hypothetical protein ACQJBY_041677 [Aegilops geniculata]